MRPCSHSPNSVSPSLPCFFAHKMTLPLLLLTLLLLPPPPGAASTGRHGRLPTSPSLLLWRPLSPTPLPSSPSPSPLPPSRSPSLPRRTPKAGRASLVSAASGSSTTSGRRELRRMRRGAGGGPCSAWNKGVEIPVRQQQDILLRLSYPPSQTVKLLFQNSLSLSSPLNFTSNYSCTILTTPLKKGISLSYSGVLAPVISIMGANNMLIGIGARTLTTKSSPVCPSTSAFPVGTWVGQLGEYPLPCPTLFIYKSHNIQFTKASIYGTVLMHSTVASTLDNLKIRTYIVPGKLDNENLGFALVNIRACGAGQGRPITPSLNVFSNNDVSGGDEGIKTLVSLSGGATGVTVSNNLLHHYGFTAIRCGGTVHTLFECYANTFSHNYISTPPSWWHPKSGTPLSPDATSIYFGMHWFSPGNVATCNWAVGGSHCYYFDMNASGVTIKGGVCSNMLDGIKINGGKWNSVSSLILYETYATAINLQCISHPDCYSDPGDWWELQRTTLWNVSSIDKTYPYMNTICNPKYRTSLDGHPCSDATRSLQDTGYCTGLPFKNDIQVIAINRSGMQDPHYWCDAPLPNQMNNLLIYNVTSAEANFSRNDFVPGPGSKILQQVKDFVACPRRTVGRKTVRLSRYYKKYNAPEPAVYQLTLTAKW